MFASEVSCLSVIHAQVQKNDVIQRMGTLESN